jgi:hypothetical protein
MSSENITKQADTTENTPTITINGKEFKQSELSQVCLNAIVIRQDLQASRVRHALEVEKIDVLTKYYDEKIEKEIASKDDKSSANSTTQASNVATASNPA